MIANLSRKENESQSAMLMISQEDQRAGIFPYCRKIYR